MKHKRAPSTKAEIIELLINRRLPHSFLSQEVRALLPHRSIGAIAGALSSLRHEYHVLTTDGKKGNAFYYSLKRSITAQDLRAIPTHGERHVTPGFTRKGRKHKPRAPDTPHTLRNISDPTSLFQHRLQQAHTKLETLITQLTVVEAALLSIEQEYQLACAMGKKARDGK